MGRPIFAGAPQVTGTFRFALLRAAEAGVAALGEVYLRRHLARARAAQAATQRATADDGARALRSLTDPSSPANPLSCYHGEKYDRYRYKESIADPPPLPGGNTPLSGGTPNRDGGA